MRRGIAVLSLAVAVVLGAASPASAVLVVTVPINTYATAAVVVPQGTELTYANADLQRHDVVASNAYRPAGSAPWCARFDPFGLKCPLFWSPLIGLGETTPVSGVSELPSGAIHEFYCTLHPWMTGTLVVV